MSKLLKQIKNRFHSESGMTLLEMVIAVAILGALGVALLQGLDTSTRSTAIIEEKSTARILITQHIESIRQLPYAATYPTAGANIYIPDQYTVAIEVQGTDDDIVWQTADGTETLQRIYVSVFRAGNPVLRICTFRTPRQRL